MDFTNILSTLIANFTKLLPIRFAMVHSYEQGVKFRFGNDINRCNHKTGMRLWYPVLFPLPRLRKTSKTGIHFYWAWIEDIEIESIREQVRETYYQTIKSKDDIEATYSVAYAYHIKNVKKYWVTIEDFDESMDNLIQSYLTEFVGKVQYTTMTKSPVKFSDKMMESINKKTCHWGVKVTRCTLVNNSTGRNIRLMQ